MIIICLLKSIKVACQQTRIRILKNLVFQTSLEILSQQNISSVVWLPLPLFHPCMQQLYHLSDRLSTCSLTFTQWWCLAPPEGLSHSWSFPVAHEQQCTEPLGLKYFNVLLFWDILGEHFWSQKERDDCYHAHGFLYWVANSLPTFCFVLQE